MCVVLSVFGHRCRSRPSSNHLLLANYTYLLAIILQYERAVSTQFLPDCWFKPGSITSKTSSQSIHFKWISNVCGLVCLNLNNYSLKSLYTYPSFVSVQFLLTLTIQGLVSERGFSNLRVWTKRRVAKICNLQIRVFGFRTHVHSWYKTTQGYTHVKGYKKPYRWNAVMWFIKKKTWLPLFFRWRCNISLLCTPKMHIFSTKKIILWQWKREKFCGWKLVTESICDY